MQLILPYLYAMAIDAAYVAGASFAATVAVYASKFLWSAVAFGKGRR